MSSAADTDATAEILNKFPGPVTLDPPLKTWVHVIVVGSIFTIIGLWLIFFRGDSSWTAWFGIIFLVSARWWA